MSNVEYKNVQILSNGHKSELSVGDVTKTQATTEAPAAGGNVQKQEGSYMPLILMGVIFVAFYLLIIRPQNKKQKDLTEKISRVKKDDKVVTVGGIHGTIEKVEDTTVVLRIDEKTKITLSKAAISDILPLTEAVKA